MVFVLFAVVVIALWVTRPRPYSPGPPPEPLPAAMDTLAVLREQATRMLRDLRGDTLGTSGGAALEKLLDILQHEPADSDAMAQIVVLSSREDSLAQAHLRANRFVRASEFLDQGRRGWQAAGVRADSAVARLQVRNGILQEILEAKRAMFTSMVHVPAGPFRRGSNRGGLDARPERDIQVSGFYIDRTEVTNAQYRAFLMDIAADGSVQELPMGNANLPVVSVSWDEAARFAAWAGKRLPTEAEWEKAARGTDGRAYPWGDEFDQARVIGRGAASVQPVGSAPLGASPYGAMDMAGNVREWTADYYDPLYYGRSPSADPTGPARGRDRVVR
ncbi:MAG: formylglycine-generating enzyme family protein, partial [Candidatus Eisenbacteria bacterium]|nr:formylglycine-generating enzyme family protein [Candidatus Eisenbacteria bacterium]